MILFFDLMEEETLDAEVDIDGIINLKTSPASHYKVKMNYGDLKLIIAILHDYVKTFDKLNEQGECPINEIEYAAYYRNKFLDIADRLGEQIEYDYEAAVKRCLKKSMKESNSDIGEEALALTMKRASQEAERRQLEEMKKLEAENKSE